LRLIVSFTGAAAMRSRDRGKFIVTRDASQSFARQAQATVSR
jgi:hypothetical protein